MSRWNALKKTYRMCTRLRAQRGGSRTGYLLDALWCSVRHGASPENYFVLRFFALPDWQRAAFLTSGRSGALDRALNRNAAAAEKEALASKARFLTVFAPDVRRAHVYAPEADFAAFCTFLDENDTFFLKPVGGTMGRGIERRRSAAIPDRAAFYNDCRAQRLLLEASIRQHPALEALSPGCVNSVRVNAARGRGGRVRLIGACLKCGRDRQLPHRRHRLPAGAGVRPRVRPGPQQHRSRRLYPPPGIGRVSARISGSVLARAHRVRIPGHGPRARHGLRRLGHRRHARRAGAH